MLPISVQENGAPLNSLNCSFVSLDAFKRFNHIDVNTFLMYLPKYFNFAITIISLYLLSFIFIYTKLFNLVY